MSYINKISLTHQDLVGCVILWRLIFLFSEHHYSSKFILSLVNKMHIANYFSVTSLNTRILKTEYCIMDSTEYQSKVRKISSYFFAGNKVPVASAPTCTASIMDWLCHCLPSAGRL